jgi:hypothetical protein
MVVDAPEHARPSLLAAALLGFGMIGWRVHPKKLVAASR